MMGAKLHYKTKDYATPRKITRPPPKNLGVSATAFNRGVSCFYLLPVLGWAYATLDGAAFATAMR